MQNVKLNVQGMSCGHCVNSIQNALKDVGANGKADLSSKTVLVEYNEEKLSLEKIKETIEEQGYDVLS